MAAGEMFPQETGVNDPRNEMPPFGGDFITARAERIDERAICHYYYRPLMTELKKSFCRDFFLSCLV